MEDPGRSSHSFQPHPALANRLWMLRVNRKSRRQTAPRLLDQIKPPACVGEAKNMQDNSVEQMEGLEATEMDVDSPPLMTEQEKRILDMYDRLDELQLEIALLQARGVLSRGMHSRSHLLLILLRILTISQMSR